MTKIRHSVIMSTSLPHEDRGGQPLHQQCAAASTDAEITVTTAATTRNTDNRDITGSTAIFALTGGR